VIVEFEGPMDTSGLAALPGVVKLDDLGDNRYRMQIERGVDIRPAIFRYAAEAGLSLIGLKKEENSLENIFRTLTGP
jgi:ABC-2 type transport system ATP-binding protein